MALENVPPMPPDAMLEAGGGGGRRIHSVEQLLAIIALTVLVSAISWGVLSRYVVTTPAAWVEEITSIAFSWLIFVGAAEVHRRRMHISVDILTSLLPKLAQRMLPVAIEIVVLGFCLFAAYLGAEQAFASEGAYTSILRIPLWVNYFGLTLGFVLMAFRSVQHLVRGWRNPSIH